MARSAQALSRVVLRAVAGALCIAAAAAIVAILSGDFSDGDLRVIGTSVLVALACATGGAGLGLRLQGTPAEVVLGNVVVVASAVVFALVAYGMWIDVEDDVFWQLAGAAGIVALAGSHACYVLARQQPTDPDSARLATSIAAGAAATSGVFGLLAVSGLADDGPWQPLAAILVVQVLATVLAPLARRLGGVATAAPEKAGELRGELHAIADALEHASSPAEVRDQAQRLRVLARRAG